MIKQGIYKEPSTNQRTFCYEINPPDYIKVWFEEPNGKPQDHWWDQEITPQKFHWLVDQWNDGNIEKVYGISARHINSLLQLEHNELLNVFNYFAYVLPHYRWTTELQLGNNIRPLFRKGKILRFVNISEDAAIEHNKKDRNKRIGEREMFGRTDDEYIRDHVFSN